MAILKPSQENVSVGAHKQINKNAYGLMTTVLQRSQYQFPRQSTIRELVSNAVDSVRERDMAVQILTGKASVSDYFEDIEGEIYADSRFDPSYYKLEHLSSDPQVTVRYIVNPSGKDTLVITDHGVGLGLNRLIGYFSLGFSSKRLSKLPLGKFGIGGKAALSVAEYFTMETVYNGYKTAFNIYNTTFQPITPQFNLEKDEQNDVILTITDLNDRPLPIYGVKTTEKNGVSIYVEAKKHHLQEYIVSAKQQLMYFDNVRFVIHEHGQDREEDIHATILYEDEHILVSDNSFYTKPHILLNKVNYGLINFEELDMVDIRGNIGIKLLPEEVEVTPSRESLIWSDITKEAVTKKFNKAVISATNLVQISLETSKRDFVEWYMACSSALSSMSTDPVLHALSGAIDTAKISPSWDKDIKYSSQMFDAFSEIKIMVVSYDHRSSGQGKIKRTESKGLTNPIFIKGRENHSNIKDKYLLSVYPSGFTTITILSETPFSNLLCTSTSTLNYDEVEVIGEFSDDDDIGVSAQEQQTRLISHAERRNIEGTMPIAVMHRYKDAFTFKELAIANITNVITEVETYYGTDEDSDLILSLKLILQDNTPDYTYYSTVFGISSQVLRVFKVSKKYTKYFKGIPHITRFFKHVQNNTIMMSEHLVKWNTARRIKPMLDSMVGLYNLSIAPDARKFYREMYTYIDTYYTRNHKLQDLEDYLDKIEDFQVLCTHPTSSVESIGSAALALFDDSSITNARCIDLDLYKRVEALLDQYKPLLPLINCIDGLGNSAKSIDDCNASAPLPAVLDYLTNLAVILKVNLNYIP